MRGSFSPLLWATVLLIEFVVSVRLRADTQADQLQALSIKANQILVQLEKIRAELNLKPVGPTEFKITWNQFKKGDEFDSMMIVGPSVEIDSKDYAFTFGQKDGRLLDFGILAAGTLPQPEKPLWTKAKAIAIGTAFLKVLVDPLDVKLGEPIAEYIDVQPHSDVHHGYWSVCWPRIDSEGHPFFGDHVTVDIPEDYASLRNTPICSRNSPHRGSITSGNLPDC